MRVEDSPFWKVMNEPETPVAWSTRLRYGEDDPCAISWNVSCIREAMFTGGIWIHARWELKHKSIVGASTPWLTSLGTVTIELPRGNTPGSTGISVLRYAKVAVNGAVTNYLSEESSEDLEDRYGIEVFSERSTRDLYASAVIAISEAVNRVNTSVSDAVGVEISVAKIRQEQPDMDEALAEILDGA